MADGLINFWAAQLWSAWPALLAAPFIGSFLGVLITRLPTHQPIALARSACPTCHHPLAPRDLIPLLSFASLRGRCRHCATPIPPFHLWIELAALATAATAALVAPDDQTLWISCALGYTLLTLAWIDATTLRLPDILTLPLIVAGLATALWQDPDNLANRAIGAALGYTLLWALAQTYRRLRGRDGIGLGDAKLLAAGGAWVGAAMLPWVILSASLAGLAFAALIKIRGGKLDGSTRLPFGPFLAAAIWGVWLWMAWPS